MSDRSTPFSFRLRVYYEDTDAQGVVYYANYFKFMERARTEWLRAHGVDQVKLREETGLVFVVAGTEVKFHAPARFDDELVVTVAVVSSGRARFTLEQKIYRGALSGELLCEGMCVGACIDVAQQRPRRMPERILSELFQ